MASGYGSQMEIILGQPAPEPGPSSNRSPWARVDWRTIIGAVMVVVGVMAAVLFVVATQRILVWIVIAGFFAIILAPSVRRVQGRLGERRVLATGIVMFSFTVLLFGLIAFLVMPIRTQVVRTASDLPGTIDAAANGTGPIGHLVSRLNLNQLVHDHQDQLNRWAVKVSGSSISIARSVLNGVLGFLTIFVIAFLFLTQSSAMGNALLPLIPRRRQTAAKRVALDAAAAVSGYMIGNLLISLIAGFAAFVVLLILRVPNPAVLALWVAFADLIPLVGATLGAVVAVFAAFLHTTSAGVASIVFFIIYQQFENSVLQTAVMSRTVKVNPLWVLLSVLLGVELFGYIGAVLAIPLAGSVQVLLKEIWGEVRRDRLVMPDEFEIVGSSS